MTLKPHKACDAKLDKIKKVMWVMPKLDGVRALHVNGDFQSRTLTAFPNVNLVAFNRKVFWGLDGELIKGEATSGFSCRDTTSGISTIYGPPAKEFTWHIFDSIELGVPYAKRYERAAQRVEQLASEGLNLQIVPFLVAQSLEEVAEIHAHYVDEGYEGSILRDPGGMYKSGRATVTEGAFLRIKDFIEEEAEVLEVIEGEANNNAAVVNKLGFTARSSHKANKVKNGMVGSLRCRDLKTNQTIIVAAGRLTHAERAYYFENPTEILLRIIKYRTMAYGRKDLPRFPTFQCFRAAFDM